MFTFDSQIRLGMSLPDFDEVTVKNEPMLFSCDWDSARNIGGPITRAFLDKLAYAWGTNVGRWQNGVYISLDQEVIFHDRPYSAEWIPVGHYVTLALVRKFELGESHDYYDGPHCCIKLGWFRINYSWDWCKKCMPDDESS